MPTFKKYLSSGLLAAVAAIGGALLEASTDLIKKNFEPALASSRNMLEDWFSPLPRDALIGITLQTYMPSPAENDFRSEEVSASIPAKSCRKPGGHSIVRVFDEAPNKHHTNAVMMIHCRPSGRVSIALAPQSGETVQIYEGRFQDGDKVGFPGVPGSYYAGVLTMHRLDEIQPTGPWEPVNIANQERSH